MAEYLAKPTTISKGSGPAVAIASVTNITPPNVTRDSLETTVHGPSLWRTYKPGLLDAGEMTIEVLWDPADATHAFLAHLTAAKDDYTITFPDTSTWEFKAFVTGFQPTGEVDGLLAGAVTYKLSGKITETPAA